MVMRAILLGALTVILVACSGAPAQTTRPAATVPAGNPTAAPAGNPTAAPVAPTVAPGGPVGGDMEARARALLPPGAVEIGEFEVGGLYQVTASSTMSIADLEAFWTQAIPAQGMTLAGKFTASGTLTMSITNPDGGIVASPSDEGGVLIVISLGLSS